MRRRLLFATLLAGVLAGALAIFSMSASAQLRTFLVKLPTGDVIRVTVDAPAGVPMDQVPGLPGTPIQELTPPGGGDEGGTPPGGNGGGDQGGEKPKAPSGPSGNPGGPSGGGDKGGKPSSDKGSDQKGERGEKKPDRPSNEPQSEDEEERAEEREDKNRDRPKPSPNRNSDGTPTRTNPTFFDALPTTTPGTAVPNFVIRKFQVPIFLLPIYQAAGIQYGIRWEILAAINEIETDYGRNLNVSSAGALGWMQFIPSSWKAYGVDANDDGKKDPYNPVDAIFAAARYLKAAGAEKDLRRAIFAYNHADWYVDSVMLRAKLIAGVPGDLVGSLTGLTQGRFPVAARARYADDVLERELKRRVKKGENAAAVLEDADRRSIDIFSENGAPVVAANDGIIKKVGESKTLGRYIVLQDVYGNRYTYAGLGSVSQLYPVPKVDIEVDDNAARAVSANSSGDPSPDAPASAGRQADGSDKVSAPSDSVESDDSGAKGTVTYKPRIFAHPYRANPRKNGAVEQIFNRATSQKGFATYKGLFAHVYGLNAQNAVLRPLKPGARVIAGTLLGRVGRPDPGKAAHVRFSIRPAGRGAPTIDPKPILDGWKLLESTAIYRANGKNALYSSSDAFSIGQILLLPKPLLQKRVLSDERIDIYPGGRNDVRSGQIDRRVLATLEFLAESGLRPTVTSLRTGHSKFTSSGNVSHHWHGSAVDIAQINGVPIMGHQDKGGVTEQSVKRLMLLQGTMRPDQIISLLDFGSNTVAMGDHDDHIHVGFRPLYGENAKLGQQAVAVLKPGQWNDLISRLRELENPVVPTKPSKYALPADKKKRSSAAHSGE